MSYLKDREIWLSNVPTGNPPAGYFWKFIQNGKVVVRDSSGNNQIMVATSGSQAITGSLTVTGGITGTATTASYVEYSDVANKPALVSGSSQVTYSGLTGIPSGIVSGSSQVSFNGIVDKPTLVSGSSQVEYSGLTGIPSGIVSGSAQIASFGIFATTGSNGFNGSQSITGSLTVTGQVVAQTLNVQQVTSSIVFSSGSNIFGNSLSNTQQFTGSVGVTGSLTINGTATFSSSVTAASAIISGASSRIRLTDTNITNPSFNTLLIEASAQNKFSLGVNSTTSQNYAITIDGTNQNVGIGTTSPNAKLRIQNDNSTIPSLIVRDGGTPTANLIEATSNAYGNSFILSATGIATFAGTTVAANGSINIESTDPAIRFRYTGGTANSRIYEWRAVAAGGVNDIMQLRLWNDAQSSATTLFTVSPTGAGVFSSSVTATSGAFIAPNTVTGTLLVQGGKNDVTSTGEINSRIDFGSNDASVGETDGIKSGGRIASVTEFSNGAFVGMAFSTYQQGRSPALREAMRIYNDSSVGVFGNFSTTGAATFSSSVTVQSGNSLFVNNATNTRSGFLRTSGTGTELSSFAGAGEPLILIAPDTTANIRFYTGGSTVANERMRITSGGQVLFGTTSGTGITTGTSANQGVGIGGGVLEIQTNNNSNIYLSKATGYTSPDFTAHFVNGNYVGGISTNGSSTSYATASDYRLKQDLKDFDGITLINKIKTYDYEWKVDNTRMFGVIAHELQEVLPYAVTGEKDAERMQGVDYSKLIPVLVKSIQEQQTLIESLKSRIEILEQ